MRVAEESAGRDPSAAPPGYGGQAARLGRRDARAPHGGRRSGFTLLEVMLAVALGAVIMTVATMFVFSMAELWGAGANERLFKKHTRGVSRFFERSLQQASVRYADGEAAEPVFWMDWEGDGSATVQYLSFELDTSPGALVWPEQPMPSVVCSLDLDPREGLFLLWRSRLEADFAEEPPRRTLVSPFVRQLKYHYIDYAEETPDWEILTEPKQNADQSYVLPQRLELVFDYKGTLVPRQLALPAPPKGLPLF